MENKQFKKKIEELEKEIQVLEKYILFNGGFNKLRQWKQNGERHFKGKTQ